MTALHALGFTFVYIYTHTLEKEMATHSSILAWRIPWTEEPGGLQSMGAKGSDTTEQLTLSYILLLKIQLKMGL